MPKSAGYSGTPLVRKLGIKPGATVGLIGAPNGIEETIGALPDGAVLRTRPRGSCDLALAFARAERDLGDHFERAEKLTGGTGIWIAWPKGSSEIETDLTENVVRDVGLARGLVDHKVCAIDETWSGLRFARRGGG